MAPLPELMPELVGEILLRLPPDDRARAALVCKPWLRTLCDPAFLRRYRAFHGAPPLLGLLHRIQLFEGDRAQRLAPTTAAPLSPYPDGSRTRPVDCRVLLHVADGGGCWHFVVWDPVTGDKQRLPEPGIPYMYYSAAVFCAVAGCDHLDCHGGPFRVAFIANGDLEQGDKAVKASVFSSETSAWSMTVSLDTDSGPYARHLRGADHFSFTPIVHQMRGAIIGDEIYFRLWLHNVIVKYHWRNNYLSIINPHSPDEIFRRIAIMATEDDSLGFACIEDSCLFLWSRKENSEGDAEWVQSRVIELEKVIPGASPHDRQKIVVGSAEGVCVIFISTDAGLFTLELKTKRARKVGERGDYYKRPTLYELLHSRSLSIVIGSKD